MKFAYDHRLVGEGEFYLLLSFKVDTSKPLSFVFVQMALHFVFHLTLHWGWAVGDPHFNQEPC